MLTSLICGLRSGSHEAQPLLCALQRALAGGSVGSLPRWPPAATAAGAAPVAAAATAQQPPQPSALLRQLHSSVQAQAQQQAQQQEQQEQQQEQQEQPPQQPPQQQRPEQPPQRLDVVPVLHTHMILKSILLSERPLTSHELYAAAREQYGERLFPSRSAFKRFLKGIVRKRWVAARPPAGWQQPKKLPKGKKARAEARAGGGPGFVFEATYLGRRVRLDDPAGGALPAAAQAAADEWTRRELPQYAGLVRGGSVPISWANRSLFPPEERAALWRGRQQQQQLQQQRPELGAQGQRRRERPEHRERHGEQQHQQRAASSMAEHGGDAANEQH